MKKGKILFSALCVMALTASMSATAFAADKTITSVTGPDDNKADVEVKLSATAPVEEEVYNVNVSWTEMSFEYEGAASVWDAGTHTRTEAGDNWSNGGKGTITVTNHSNVPVDISNSYKPATDGQYDDGVEYNGVTVDLTDFGKTDLTAGVLGNPNGTPGQDQTTCDLTVIGAPEDDIGTDVVVGTITVTVSAHAV